MAAHKQSITEQHNDAVDNFGTSSELNLNIQNVEGLDSARMLSSEAEGEGDPRRRRGTGDMQHHEGKRNLLALMVGGTMAEGDEEEEATRVAAPLPPQRE